MSAIASPTLEPARTLVLRHGWNAMAYQILNPGIRLSLAWVRVHGRRFYNFAGLEHFKSKFQPEGWEPIYAVTNRPRISVRTLYAIAGAFGGTSPIVFIGRALLRALRQEAHWALRRR
ncbi:MAG TPA: hypothetical protein VEW48_14030 [Thermoanaerobaculia bacterium]|nr:hypothetical protein [Thermoanaerobaculia bacterium]